MWSDVVTTGQYCDISGCQRVTIEHRAGGLCVCSTELRNDKELAVSCALQNGDIDVDVELQNPIVNVSTELRNDKNIKVALSLVCRTSVGSWEYLLVEEGKLLLIDGEAVMVRKG